MNWQWPKRSLRALLVVTLIALMSLAGARAASAYDDLEGSGIGRCMGPSAAGDDPQTQGQCGW